MEIEWVKFLSDNASAVFALIGALGGSILSFIGALLLKRREFSLATANKLLERRISAHENLITLASEMRVMINLGDTTPAGEVRRSPKAMLSREDFEKWFIRFTQLSLQGTSWLSTEAKREVNFVQDYLLTLHMYLVGVSSEEFPALGEVVRQDFIDLSSSLEKKAFNFFQSGIHKLRPDSLYKWHKYERTETERRLNSCALLKNHEAFSKAARVAEKHR